MDKVRAILTKYPIKTRLNLRGTLIVARDIAHARIKQMLDEGKPMPEYFKKHPVYYAGPAKTPQGMASGSFGPTTAGRMDPYVDLFQSQGGSLVRPCARSMSRTPRRSSSSMTRGTTFSPISSIKNGRLYHALFPAPDRCCRRLRCRLQVRPHPKPLLQGGAWWRKRQNWRFGRQV